MPLTPIKIKTSLGKRVRYFRKRSKMSQFDLENKAELNFGVLSRVENNLVNPTKETLLKVADILNLNSEEIIYLIHPQKLNVSSIDMESAINIARQRIDSSIYPMYLLDNFRRLVYPGEAALKFFGFSREEANNLTGTYLVEFIFDPKFGIRSMIPKEEFEKLALSRMHDFQYYLEMLIDNGEMDEEIQRISALPDFERIYKMAKTLKVDRYALEEVSFTLKRDGKEYPFYFNPMFLIEDDRFVIIEYIPKR